MRRTSPTTFGESRLWSSGRDAQRRRRHRATRDQDRVLDPGLGSATGSSLAGPRPGIRNDGYGRELLRRIASSSSLTGGDERLAPRARPARGGASTNARHPAAGRCGRGRAGPQPIALRMKNSGRTARRRPCVRVEPSRLASMRLASSDWSTPVPTADLADDGRSSYPQVVGDRPTARSDRRRPRSDGPRRSSRTRCVADLVDQVPPRRPSGSGVVEAERVDLPMLRGATGGARGRARRSAPRGTGRRPRRVQDGRLPRLFVERVAGERLAAAVALSAGAGRCRG